MSLRGKKIYRLATQVVIGAVLLAGAQSALGKSFRTDSMLIAMSDEVRSMCQQAEQLINGQRFSEAIRLLQRAGTIDPSCAEVHGYLGMAYQNSLNTRQAVEEYTQALRLNPQMSFLNVNLGTCYMNMNQLDQAVPYFERYLQENPNAPDAQQVRRYIQQAGSRKGQQDLRGLMEQGQALLNQRRYSDARRAFEQAVSTKPDWAPGHFYLGYALAQSGEHQRAIGEFQSALQLDPNLKEAVMNIASNYQSMGDSVSAITWYERYLQENPGSPKAGDIRSRINGLRQQAARQQQQPQRQVAAAPVQSSNTGQTSQWQSEDPYAGLVPPQQSPWQASPTDGVRNQPGVPPNTAYAGQAPTAPPEDEYLDSATAGGRYFRWPAERMPIRVYIAPGAGATGYRDSFSRALADAFAAWAKGSDNRIAFWIVTDPSQADITCDWTGDPAKVVEAGRSVEGGLTKLSGQEQPGGVDVKIVRARVTLLTKDRGGTPLSDDDMKKVCLHEIGHALGLNGHSNNNHEIMFFSESPSVWPALTKRDKATIRRLYASYPKMVDAQPGGGTSGN